MGRGVGPDGAFRRVHSNALTWVSVDPASTMPAESAPVGERSTITQPKRARLSEPAFDNPTKFVGPPSSRTKHRTPRFLRLPGSNVPFAVRRPSLEARSSGATHG